MLNTSIVRSIAECQELIMKEDQNFITEFARIAKNIASVLIFQNAKAIAHETYIRESDRKEGYDFTQLREKDVIQYIKDCSPHGLHE